MVFQQSKLYALKLRHQTHKNFTCKSMLEHFSNYLRALWIIFNHDSVVGGALGLFELILECCLNQFIPKGFKRSMFIQTKPHLPLFGEVHDPYDTIDAKSKRNLRRCVCSVIEVSHVCTPLH